MYVGGTVSRSRHVRSKNHSHHHYILYFLLSTKHIPQCEQDAHCNDTGHNDIVSTLLTANVFHQSIQSGDGLCHGPNHPRHSPKGTTLLSQIRMNFHGLMNDTRGGCQGILNVIAFSQQMFHGWILLLLLLRRIGPRKQFHLFTFAGPHLLRFGKVRGQIEQNFSVSLDEEQVLRFVAAFGSR